VNKNDLIAAVASATNSSKADAQRALDATLNAIAAALASGKEVRLVNFGTFVVVKRRATEGRNPRTGAPIKIPASSQPKFRPGKALKEAEN
jgi:DNA-binding protein HU-beta